VFYNQQSTSIIEKEETMRARLRCALLILSLGSLALASCAHVVVTDSGTVAVEGVVADLTLELFWNLASVQVQNPSAASRLLAMDPRDPSGLEALGAGFDAYRQQLASVAQVRPLVLFLPHDADPVEEARKRGLTSIPWPSSAPPALFSGPQVDTLIVFEPIAETRVRPGAAVTRLASLAGLTHLALAPSADQQAIRQLYQVSPGEWTASTVFKHTRCVNRGSETQFITKLFYQGGFTDTKVTPLTEQSWGPCALPSDPDLMAVTVQQPGQKKPGKPVIIAASYFLDPRPSPLLARWISVR
jgi:hypothetical protein